MVRLVTIACLLAFGPVSPAAGCGDMAVTLQLIQDWPSARGPMVAEIKERRHGRLPAPRWQVAPNGDPIDVRQRRAVDVLRALQARLGAVETSGGEAHSFALLFLNDHLWSRYEIDPERVRLRLKGLRPVLPRAGEARVHVSAWVLDVLLSGAIGIAEAEAAGVLVVDGDATAVLATRRVLRAALGAQAG